MRLVLTYRHNLPCGVIWVQSSLWCQSDLGLGSRQPFFRFCVTQVAILRWTVSWRWQISMQVTKIFQLTCTLPKSAHENVVKPGVHHGLLCKTHLQGKKLRFSSHIFSSYIQYKEWKNGWQETKNFFKMLALILKRFDERTCEWSKIWAPRTPNVLETSFVGHNRIRRTTNVFKFDLWTQGLFPRSRFQGWLSKRWSHGTLFELVAYKSIKMPYSSKIYYFLPCLNGERKRSRNIYFFAFYMFTWKFPRPHSHVKTWVQLLTLGNRADKKKSSILP